MPWTIERYTPQMAERWDEFVRASRNGTFLFERAYMDYHADRFTDRSLMAYRNGKLRALLPANITPDGVIHSHQGLTYGGWVLPPSHIDGSDLMELWDEWFAQCRAEGITAVDYKPMPWIFARQPSQEDIYCLFRCGARLTASQLSSTIDLRNNPGLNSRKRRQVRDARQTGAVIKESDDIEGFMHLLQECLYEHHKANPVHTASELRMLKNRFPDNIRLFTASLNHDIDAGLIIYDTGHVAHSQYTAYTPEGRENNLVSLLYNHLITEVFPSRAYFDFGTSNEDNGRYLNDNLLRQKATLGGTGVAFNRYEINI